VLIHICIYWLYGPALKSAAEKIDGPVPNIDQNLQGFIFTKVYIVNEHAMKEFIDTFLIGSCKLKIWLVHAMVLFRNLRFSSII